MPPKDDTAVQEAVQQDTAVQETAPVETTVPEVAQSDDDNFFADVDAEVAEGDKAEAEPAEDAPVETADRPRGEDGKFIKKEQADEVPDVPLEAKSEKSVNRWQQMANKNKELEQEIARLKSQESQFATEQELLNEVNPDTGEYYTPQEVERIAFAQSREQQAQSTAQQRYNLEVQQSQQTLASEAQQALSEFPIFDEQSPEYNAALSVQADEILKPSLIYDDNGTLVGSSISPYKLYKSLAYATQANAPVYQAKAQKATEKMLANADVSPGASQATKTKVDPMMAAFDEEAARF